MTGSVSSPAARTAGKAPTANGGSAGAASPRRTQAERSATSRSQILDAAIECLVSSGYAATTMELIARKASMSKGRVQHQFATKAEIMAEVSRSVYLRNSAELSPSGLLASDPVGRLREYVGKLGKIFRRRDVLAAFEIRFALRSDRQLKKAIAPLVSSFDISSFAELEQLLQAAGMKIDAEVWMRLIVAAVRGFAFERALQYETNSARVAGPALDALLDALIVQIDRGRPDD